MSATVHPARPVTVGTAARWRRAALALITVLLALLTVRLLTPLWTPEPLPVLDTLGGGFRLSSTLGRELTLDDFSGRIVLLNFGYTACPDVCPTVLARMRALMLDLQALEIDAAPLFVTLDPERDRPETLERYVSHFHSSLVGLRGTPQQTAQAAANYRVHAVREALPEGGYGIAHSTEIYLIDGRGRVRATFGSNVPLPAMVDTVRRLAREPQESHK